MKGERRLVVALFRPNQRERKSWIDRLRQSGYTVQYVHDPCRISPEASVIVVDSSVSRWKDFIRMFEGQGTPVFLLIDDAAEASWPYNLQIDGTIHSVEPTDGLFERLLEDVGDRTSALQGDVPLYDGMSLQLPKDKEASDSGGEIKDREPPSEKEQDFHVDDTIPIADRPTLSQRKVNRGPVPALNENVMLPTTGSVSETVQIENLEPQLKFEPVERRQPLSSSLTQRQRIFLPPTVAVYAAKGGIGKTTFLLHLAARLSQEGQKVCVVDADFILGNVAAWMNITPHKTVVDLAHRIDDPEASRTCLLPVKEGFFILAAPPEPGALTLRSEQLLAILRFLKEEMDIVLIDTPQYIDNWTRLILEQTDLLFAMTSGDPASLINLERMRPALSRLQPTPDIQLVWNRLTEPALKEAWKERLPWPTILELPEDLTIRSAVRRGEWIADSPVSPYRLQIGRLVDQWMGRELRANEKGTRLTRLWSKIKGKGESMHES